MNRHVTHHTRHVTHYKCYVARPRSVFLAVVAVQSIEYRLWLLKHSNYLACSVSLQSLYSFQDCKDSLRATCRTWRATWRVPAFWETI